MFYQNMWLYTQGPWSRSHCKKSDAKSSRSVMVVPTESLLDSQTEEKAPERPQTGYDSFSLWRCLKQNAETH